MLSQYSILENLLPKKLAQEFIYESHFFEYILNPFSKYSKMKVGINNYLVQNKEFNCVINTTDSGSDVAGFRDVSCLIIKCMKPLVKLGHGFKITEKSNKKIYSLDNATEIRHKWQIKAGGLTGNGVDHSISAVASEDLFFP